jgi:hypothetical protein
MADAKTKAAETGADVVESVGSFDYANLVRPDSFSDGAYAEKASEVMATATELERNVGTMVEAINKDHRLSAAGKREQRLDVASRYQKQIDELENEAAAIERAHEKTMGAMTETMPDPSDPAAETRQGEIRAYLRGLDAGEIRKVYQRACDEDDLETIAAIERAPKSLAVVDADTIERFRLQRLQRKYPTLAKKAANQQALAQTIRGGSAYLKRRLGLE